MNETSFIRSKVWKCTLHCLKVISIIYLNVLQYHYYKNILLKIIRNMRLPSFISIIKGHVKQISCERTWVEHWPKLFENGTLQ